MLLALARKHIRLASPLAWPPQGAEQPTLPARHDRDAVLPALAALPQGLPALRERLLRLHHDLTDRELDVCARVLQGMTHEGIASDLSLGLPTVKTYRNRAFARMGIHFRNELFAKVLGR